MAVTLLVVGDAKKLRHGRDASRSAGFYCRVVVPRDTILFLYEILSMLL